MDNIRSYSKDYIERRNKIKARHSKRHRPKPRKKSTPSLFFLRANICMGAAVIIIMASYINSTPTNAFCVKVKEVISHNLTLNEIKTSAMELYNKAVSGNIAVMAGNGSYSVTLDDEIKTQISNRSDIYYNNQKKTD